MTILTAPGNNSSVNNEMIFVVQDAKALNLVTYTNYKYVLDVYVDGVLKARLRSTPDPTHSLGRFDVSVILRDYVPAYGLKANYASATETYDINIAYTVKIGEEYGDTLYTNIVTDTERTAYKTYAPRPFLTTDMISGKMNSIFSSRTRVAGVPFTDHKENKWNIIPYLGNSTGTTVSCNFEDANGVTVGFGFAFSYTTPLSVMQMNLGFQKVSAGLTQQQKDLVERLIFNVSGVTHTIQYACTKYTPVIIAWLNPYGAYESQSFGLVSKKQNQISRKEYAQLPYQMNSSGVISYDSNGVMHGSKKGYASTVKVSLAVTSHLLPDTEYTWLADLFNSTDVYFFSTVLDRWVPCSVGDNNYEYRTYKNSKLKPLQFSINFTDEYNSQYL